MVIDLDESFQAAEDVSLESYVQAVVEELEALRAAGVKAERVRFKLREFPAETRAVLDWIRRFGMIQARTSEGRVVRRQPSAGELAEGCLRCGLRRIEQDFDFGRIKSTTRDLIESGRVNFLVLQTKFPFTLHGSLQQSTVCWQPYVFEKTADRIYDLSYSTGIQSSTLFIAAFVASIAQSEVWVPSINYPYADHAEQATRAFVAWLPSVLTELMR